MLSQSATVLSWFFPYIYILLIFVSDWECFFTKFKKLSVMPPHFLFLDRRQRGPIRSVLLVIIGSLVDRLVGWLVGNVVFSETALRIFLIFCMKLGDYKCRKVTEPDFWKKFLIWRYLRKGLQISPKSDTLIFFSKTALTIFLVFGLKLVLNMTFNLNETYFSEKFAIWRYLTSKSSKNCPNWGFWPFSRLCIISFPWFST